MDDRVLEYRFQRLESQQQRNEEDHTTVQVLKATAQDQGVVLERVLAELGTLRMAIIGAAITFALSAVGAALIATGHLG